MKKVLVLNSGSSSLKYALFNTVNSNIKTNCASGIVEKIGQDSQNVKHSYTDSNDSKEKIYETKNNLTSHRHALEHVLNLLSHSFRSSLSNWNLEAVGHRVVHGGESLTKACVINAKVIDLIEQASVLAPLHNPSNLSGIRTAMEIFPSSVQQVAVFDTAFHSTIPKSAYLYGIPYHYYKDHNIRKYGFHGTSHEYAMNEASKFLRKPIGGMNLITCHIGAGASMSCIKGGVCIDTSMGMTPMSGLLMQTRCGDLDPGVIFYLMKHLKMSAEDVEGLLLKESGWVGLSGLKNALELEKAFEKNDVSERTETTVKYIIHRIKSYLGAYYWNLNGDVDAVIFTGGVGENWSLLRELLFDDENKLGFHIDKSKNKITSSVDGIVDVSSNKSEKRILVIPTNEEYSIADTTLNVINSTVGNNN